MKINSNQLIEDLIEHTRVILNEAEKMKELPLEELNFRVNAESWSVLECIEHLNRYGDFYIPEISNKIKTAQRIGKQHEFKSGMMGNYFALSMLPGDKMKKMKTFKDKDPMGSKLDLGTLEKFTSQQNKMLELLNMSREIDLNKEKCSISITKWIHFRLGDTFRFVIFHNLRHMDQAKKILS